MEKHSQLDELVASAKKDAEAFYGKKQSGRYAPEKRVATDQGGCYRHS